MPSCFFLLLPAPHNTCSGARICARAASDTKHGDTTLFNGAAVPVSCDDARVVPPDLTAGARLNGAQAPG